MIRLALFMAAAVAVCAIAIRAAGTAYAPWLGGAVFIAACVVVIADERTRA